MMKAMRDRVKMIYWVVIVTFVGLTFLVWGIGLDNGTGPVRDSGVVANVNGTEITFDAWNERVNSVLAQMRAQLGDGQTLTENQILRAREEAFDSLVLETLERREAARMGLSVTDEEIVDILGNNPPPYLLAQFTDENGNIDYDAYARALKDPTVRWAQIENYIRQSVPLEKLEQRIVGQAVVGEAEIREAFADQSVRALAEYIGVDFAAVELPEAEVDAATIEAWYQEHLDEYKQPARATVRFVILAKTSSAADENDVVEILQGIRGDVLEGRLTFAEAAETYSEDQTNAAQGGDLGFFDRNRMVGPFSEAAFSMEIGDISDPIKTQFGYHLIYVADEKTDERGDRIEIQASHILVKLVPSPDTVAAQRLRVDDLREAAAQLGLDAAATADSLTVETSTAFPEGGNIPRIANSISGARWAFQNDIGTLSPVFETQDNFYILEVAEHLPEGHRPLDEVQTLVTSRIQREQRADLASKKLVEAWVKVEGGLSLEEAANELDLTYALADTFTLRENIQGIGFASSFARAALELDVGERAFDVRTQRGTYIIQLLYKSEFDEEAFRAARPGIARSLLFNRRRQILADWQKQLRDSATIEDYRDQYL